jgi:hypothetical protein
MNINIYVEPQFGGADTFVEETLESLLKFSGNVMMLDFL